MGHKKAKNEHNGKGKGTDEKLENSIVEALAARNKALESLRLALFRKI
jgi:hypothetical protein